MRIRAGTGSRRTTTTTVLMDITRLTQPLSRRALPRPNLVYFLWRFVANGRRTLGAVTMRHAYGDARATGRELKDQGIVVGTSETLLSDIGQLALDEASAQVLEASRSEQVRSVIAAGAWYEKPTIRPSRSDVSARCPRPACPAW